MPKILRSVETDALRRSANSFYKILTAFVEVSTESVRREISSARERVERAHINELRLQLAIETLKHHELMLEIAEHHLP